MSRISLYDILQVKKDATQEEIKASYRRMAQRFHPDRHPGDPEAATKFMDVQEAYEVLSDPARREKYDETGEVVRVTLDPDAPLYHDTAMIFAQIFSDQSVEETDDIIALMIEKVIENKNRLHRAVLQTKTSLARMQAFRKRVSKKGEEEAPNVVGGWLDQQIRGAEEALGKYSEAIEFSTRLAQYFRTYDWDTSSEFSPPTFHQQLRQQIHRHAPSAEGSV